MLTCTLSKFISRARPLSCKPTTQIFLTL
ncbi:hypothetical protein RHECNPAF_2330052 [Rhizobium etli CNPAF512]|nr:hypothetical protein RHECNPAF_2330052 [Rhizobium etli CNPAF512]